jgi:hypothetical protein
MADLREVFPILENPADGAGVAITKVVEGDAASSVSGAVPSLVAKDSSGNLIFLTLDAQGRLPVTSEGAGSVLRARGELAAGNATTGMVTVTGAVINLTATESYADISFVVSCFRETHAQLVFNNNGSESILTDVVLGPGQYTFESDLPKDKITAGSTGTQELKVVARNIDKASSIRASIGAVELA